MFNWSNEPLNETIDLHGLFIIKSKEEIHRAFDDYTNG
ncbi:hypothetical protein FNJ88_11335 [Chryseobacterium sp. SNU WT5]|nr:pirin-like C-terminal cupin domain-containing protein [Chryseobacterium sp. SNU WT5]QDP86111.1 hypothetical protein FNJ88_11335 [Chryseobacterium sp. SNU WT5]